MEKKWEIADCGWFEVKSLSGVNSLIKSEGVTSEDQNMHPDKLNVSSGITNSQIKQLINFANKDPQVVAFTSDPKRFKDLESFNSWCKERPRSLFTMSDDSGNLLGLIWLAEQEIPVKLKGYEKFGVTFAIRIYGEARGKGFSQFFMKEAIDRFKKSSAYKNIKNKGLWLSTRSNNVIAQKAYRKFGFRKMGNSNENGKILMVLEK